VKKKLNTHTSSPKVITFRRDSAFFSKKANQSWDKFHYEKALRYFKRAVEFDEGNPTNYCHMAGVLTDMGNYEESNQVLWHVVENIDPSLTECFYFMANNYAYLQKYEQSEEAIVHYLEHDHQGQYVEESEELIHFLQMELERPTYLKHIKSREGMVEHEHARELLENGKFDDAIKILELIVMKKPDFLAAYNNLAIAYYYMGYNEKAFDAIGQVLQRDLGNIHALCNKAIFLQYLGKPDECAKIVESLRKTYPFVQEHLFKLATTMGILRQHDKAYLLFRRIIRSAGGNIDASVYHYAAVAACNHGRIQNAKWHWQYIQKHHPDHKVAPFYLHMIERIDHRTLLELVTYQFHLPHEDSFSAKSSMDSMLLEKYKKEPLTRASFFWTMEHGDTADKLKVLHAFSWIGDQDIVAMLKKVIVNQEEEKYIKQLAVFVLRRLGNHELLEANFGHEVVVLQPIPYAPSLPEWRPEWQDVLHMAYAQMQTQYDIMEQFDVEILWVEYLSRTYPVCPKIMKKEGWAASLEYLIAKMYHNPISYQEVADRYHVSASTVKRNVQLIDHTCQVKDKMKAIQIK
jgi:tetratricopeptide (TPR) repeat protein